MPEVTNLPDAAQHVLAQPLTGRVTFYIKELPPAPVKSAQIAIQTEAEIHRAEDNPVVSRIGQAMHRLLEWGNASDANASAAAREFELSPEEGAQALSLAQRIFQGEGTWAWDHAVVGWQENEVELMYQGESLRLDRLVQRKDTLDWWVLDYKSAHAPQDEPELVAQLQNYRDAVQAIYPHATVKAAFLTGHGELVELPA
jgi:ATP-dependent helicase/nuclease subunit A